MFLQCDRKIQGEFSNSMLILFIKCRTNSSFKPMSIFWRTWRWTDDWKAFWVWKGIWYVFSTSGQNWLTFLPPCNSMSLMEVFIKRVWISLPSDWQSVCRNDAWRKWSSCALLRRMIINWTKFVVRLVSMKHRGQLHCRWSTFAQSLRRRKAIIRSTTLTMKTLAFLSKKQNDHQNYNVNSTKDRKIFWS